MFREWLPADGPEVVRLIEELFEVRLPELQRGPIPPWTGWVAYSGGRLVGCLLARAFADEMEIGFLGVAAEFRRQGIARRLLEEALRAAERKQLRVVFLEVRRSNRAAQELYRRAGFRLVGVRRGYYSGPQKEDALVFSRLVGSFEKR